MPDQSLSVFQQYVFKSRYSKFLHDKNRREDWNETVARYFDFFTEHLKTRCNYTLTAELRKELEEAVLNFEVMPSMRAIMTAGPALQRDETSGYNCSFVSTDNPKMFGEIMYILMCLSPDTLIKTKNGTKKIKEITLDDQILSYNENTKQYEYKQCDAVIETRTESEEKIELTFEDGKTYKCTKDHKFLTSNRGWVKAQDLNENEYYTNL